MAEIVKAQQSLVLGVGCIVDKSGGGIDFAFPFETPVSFKVANYPAKHCPLCLQGLALETAVMDRIGSRRFMSVPPGPHWRSGGSPAGKR